MQMLQFESSWDKTLSDIDRERIKEAFTKTSFSNKGNVQLTPLWQAMNYKGDLLVTVLIHNFGRQVLSFQNKKLRYVENNDTVAEHTFTLPQLMVGAKKSMPWTFIFPVGSLRKDVTLHNGHVDLVD